jgi:hypothetical protein
MASGFAPEFLILAGIDIFLGSSILTVLLDRHFPGPLPYILEGGALVGFAELIAGPAFLTSFSIELQFYYSFIFAMISVLTLMAINLYLLFMRRRPFESGLLAICGTIPAGLGVFYFTSAFVNGMTLSLPLTPAIPIQEVYAMFGLSVALIAFSLAVFGRSRRPSPAAESREKLEEEPVPLAADGARSAQADGGPSSGSPRPASSPRLIEPAGAAAGGDGGRANRGASSVSGRGLRD